MHYPLSKPPTAYRLNKTKHGKSAYRQESVPGHNTVCWRYGAPANADALDMFTFSGDPVYAVHDGYISRIADPGGRLSCLYIDGNCKVTVYAHIKFKLWIRIKSWWKPAQYVKTGQVIGYVGKVLRDPHLHFEAFNCGKVLLGKTPKELALEIQEWIEEA